jgi:hypothetical protein
MAAAILAGCAFQVMQMHQLISAALVTGVDASVDFRALPSFADALLLSWGLSPVRLRRARDGSHEGSALLFNWLVGQLSSCAFQHVSCGTPIKGWFAFELRHVAQLISAPENP